MTNADKFKKVFGKYATEIWAMQEDEYLDWSNSDYIKSEASKMGDYIDRQAAIEALGDVPYVPDTWSDEYSIGEYHQYKQDKDAIESVPPSGVVPVVRCKDCEFYTEEERWCRRLGLCGAFDTNGYCSHAERREE